MSSKPTARLLPAEPTALLRLPNAMSVICAARTLTRFPCVLHRLSLLGIQSFLKITLKLVFREKRVW